MVQIPGPSDTERDRGVLTESDREYLLGESDIEPQSGQERQIRKRIRNRTRNSLLDFTLLFTHLENRDRKQIFEGEDDWIYWNSLVDTLAFLYFGANGNEVASTVRWPPSIEISSGRFDTSNEIREDRNRRLTRSAIERAALHSGIQIDELTVFPEIEASPPPAEGKKHLEKFFEKLSEEDVHPEALGTFLRRITEHEIEFDRIAEVIGTPKESMLEPEE